VASAEGQTKKSQTTAFAVMVMTFVACAWWQVSDIRKPASDEEVEALGGEGDCESRYVKRWSEADSSKKLTRSDLAQVRAICLGEAELSAKARK
jgi:hypothetical protein